MLRVSDAFETPDSSETGRNVSSEAWPVRDPRVLVRLGDSAPKVARRHCAFFPPTPLLYVGPFRNARR